MFAREPARRWIEYHEHLCLLAQGMDLGQELAPSHGTPSSQGIRQLISKASQLDVCFVTDRQASWHPGFEEKRKAGKTEEKMGSF